LRMNAALAVMRAVCGLKAALASGEAIARGENILCC
jgi:hypothetical protein